MNLEQTKAIHSSPIPEAQGAGSVDDDWIVRSGRAWGCGIALTLFASATAGDFDVYGGAERVAANVKVRDSDLHTLAGAKALALRIRVASAQVCGGGDPIIRASDGFTRCQAASVDRAVATLRSPLLADALGRPQQSLAGR